MKRVYLILILFLLNSQLSFAKKKKSVVEYTESANVFVLLENISEWTESSSGHLRVAYQKEFGLSEKDIQLFRDYREVRETYRKKLSDERAFFGRVDISEDKISHAFFNSETVDEALRKLKKSLSKGDLNFMVELFRYLKPKLSKWARESRSYETKLKEVKKNLGKEKATKSLKVVDRFLGKSFTSSRIFLSWWPKDVPPTVSHLGPYTIIHINPLTQLNYLNSSNVVEAKVMANIKSFKETMKMNSEKAFIESCQILNSKKEKALEILFERPLVLALGQMYFQKLRDKKEFDVFQKWDEDPLSNLLSKSYYMAFLQALRMKKNYGMDFVSLIGKECLSLKGIKQSFWY